MTNNASLLWENDKEELEKTVKTKWGQMASSLLCDFSWGVMNKHLFILDKPLVIDERKQYSYRSLTQWTSEIIGVIYRNMSEKFVTGAWISQKASPTQHGWRLIEVSLSAPWKTGRQLHQWVFSPLATIYYLHKLGDGPYESCLFLCF